jgi:hypothetical protein
MIYVLILLLLLQPGCTTGAKSDTDWLWCVGACVHRNGEVIIEKLPEKEKDPTTEESKRG